MLIVSDSLKLNDNALYDKGIALLSKERFLLCKKRKGDNRNNTMACELLLRAGLKSLGVEKRDFEYQKNEYGKLFIPDFRFKFNFSHSGSVCACAISEEEIGCDIERIRKYQPKLVKRFFAPDEEAYLNGIGEDKDSEFTRLWTLKESYIKYMGKGLSLPLGSFSVMDRDGRVCFFEYNILGCRAAVCKKDDVPPVLKIMDIEDIIKCELA